MISVQGGFPSGVALELELITNTNPNDTEANAAGRSVSARVARKSKSQIGRV